MTNEDWSDLTRWLKLPDTARLPIENELDLYRRCADSVAPPPSETRGNLERAAELASHLLEVIERFGPNEYRALVGCCTDNSVTLSNLDVEVPLAAEVQTLIDRPRENQDVDAFYAVPARAALVVTTTPRLDALNQLADSRIQLAALRDRMTYAAATLKRGKTGSDASNARALVKRVSEIVETCTGTPLSKGKPELYFAERLGRLADPPISANSIKGAIETLEPKKLAAEKSANYG
jgi:hypothetical protein